MSGDSSAAAYWNQREKSLATFHGPWTRTGDKYVVDEEGYYHYRGRTDDMLKVSGQWVSPFEVESALLGHEAVLEAAVVAAEDERGLVKPKAFVVPREGVEADAALAAALQEFVKDRLAPFKYPRWIEFAGDLRRPPPGRSSGSSSGGSARAGREREGAGGIGSRRRPGRVRNPLVPALRGHAWPASPDRWCGSMPSRRAADAHRSS